MPQQLGLGDAALAATVVAFGLDLLAALGILIVGWLLAGWVQRLLRRWLAGTTHVDPTLGLAIADMVRYAVLVLVVLAVLAQLGVQTTSLLAALGAAGLAVGLALQGTLANIAAGLMLLFLRPFHVGDAIDAGGVAGTVREIGLFTTELVTADGVYLSVPNGAIWNKPIRNFTRLPRRQAEVAVRVGYGRDLGAALELLRGLLAEDPRVLGEPAPPEVLVTGLGETAIEVSLRAWVPTKEHFAFAADLRRRATERLAAAGLAPPA